MNYIQIIFWVLLADSLIANIIAWTKLSEKFNKIKFYKRYLPLTKGWTVWYLIMTLFIGYLIF
jgi:hypothetical protein